MGRDAHILRAILGRSATEPPDWPSLHNQYERVQDEPALYRGSDSGNLITYGRCFDAKGRPHNPKARDQQRTTRDALNHVTSLTLAKTVTQSQPRPDGDGFVSYVRANFDQDATTMFFFRRSFFATTLLNRSAVAWVDSIRRRILAYKGYDAPFLDTVIQDFTSLGSATVFVCGMPSEIAYLILVDRVSGSLSWQPVELNSRLQNRKRLSILAAISANILSVVLVANCELQQLHILPASTLRSPLPLVDLLWRLSPQQLSSCLVSSLIPAYILCQWWRFKICGDLASTIRDTLSRLNTDDAVEDFSLADASSETDYGISAPDNQSNHAQYRVVHTGLTRRSSFQDLYYNLISVMTRKGKTFKHMLRWTLLTQGDRPSQFKIQYKKLSALPVDRLENWPHLLSIQLAADMLHDCFMYPMAGLMTRMWVNLILQNSSLLGLRKSEALAGVLRPVLPGLSSFSTIVGLRSTARKVGKVAMTFLLQAAIWTTLVGIESAVALFLARRRADKESREGERVVAERAVLPGAVVEEVE